MVFGEFGMGLSNTTVVACVTHAYTLLGNFRCRHNVREPGEETVTEAVRLELVGLAYLDGRVGVSRVEHSQEQGVLYVEDSAVGVHAVHTSAFAVCRAILVGYCAGGLRGRCAPGEREKQGNCPGQGENFLHGGFFLCVW